MKKLSLLIFTILFYFNSYAQAPQAFSYQAVIRDVSGTLVTEADVSFRISILESSITGEIVYQETQLGTTSTYGSISLEIGRGTVVTGQFDTIAWGESKHFIQLEYDVNGGSNFVNAGTTELLSVPYALYAKEAGVSEDLEARLNALTIDINNLNTRIEKLEAPKPARVGDFRDGGIVFWLNPEDSTHGLVCSLIDVDTNVNWNDMNFTIAGAYDTAVGTGKLNTQKIVNSFGMELNYAALSAIKYEGEGYKDWFLPSLSELRLLLQQREFLNSKFVFYGGTKIFENDSYWSSTEHSVALAYKISLFSNLYGWASNKYTDYERVRAVREF